MWTIHQVVCAIIWSPPWRFFNTKANAALKMPLLQGGHLQDPNIYILIIRLLNSQIIVEMKARNINILTGHLPETIKCTSLRNAIPGARDPDGKGSRHGAVGWGDGKPVTHKEATSQPAQADGEEGKGSRTTQALLGKQEDPTQRRLFLCGFHRTEASGAGRFSNSHCPEPMLSSHPHQAAVRPHKEHKPLHVGL